MIRYRSGLCKHTGTLLIGWPHAVQSVGRIITTLKTEMVMLLDFGSDVIRLIGKNIHQGTVLKIYMETVVAIHKYEPEVRIHRVQLIKLERTGTLGLKFLCTYYPEGRLGNYDITENITFDYDLGGANG